MRHTETILAVAFIFLTTRGWKGDACHTAPSNRIINSYYEKK